MAYGTLDELNSFIGLLRLHVSDRVKVREHLERVQEDLFVLGALLATPPDRIALLDKKMTMTTWSLEAMENDIDRLSTLAPSMKNFVLPGGAPASAYAHVARTVCRRAEREVVLLAAEEKVDTKVISYLNRLSDWLFALARAENTLEGVKDIEWIPDKD